MMLNAIANTKANPVIAIGLFQNARMKTMTAALGRNVIEKIPKR